MPIGVDALQAAVEAMADGAIVADTRSGAVLVNRAARGMLKGKSSLTRALLAEHRKELARSR